MTDFEQTVLRHLDEILDALAVVVANTAPRG
jgi:hypothetical protein